MPIRTSFAMAILLGFPAYCLLLTVHDAPAGIRTPNQEIMRRFEGHQQGETKRDNPVFTESAAVKVSHVSLSKSRHRAIDDVFDLQSPTRNSPFGAQTSPSRGRIL